MNRTELQDLVHHGENSGAKNETPDSTDAEHAVFERLFDHERGEVFVAVGRDNGGYERYGLAVVGPKSRPRR